MADIDPNSAPSLMPAEQPIAKADGKATTPMLEWLGALRNWTKRTVVDLTTKITTLSTSVGDLSASIVEEANIRQTEDGILAEQINTVEAKLGEGLAEGEIYFAAKAAPTGFTAAYGLHLKAGNAYAGFEALADSVGGSAIGMTANQFVFTDSGAGQQVFAYSAGVFVFSIPVVIQTGTTGARQVITSENTKIYDASNVLRVALGVNI